MYDEVLIEIEVRDSYSYRDSYSFNTGRNDADEVYFHFKTHQ